MAGFLSSFFGFSSNPSVNESNGVVALGYYHPYRGGNNPKFDDFSGMILSLKNKESKAIDYFSDLFLRELGSFSYGSVVFVCVPSSTASNSNDNGIARLVRILANRKNQIDGSNFLIRSSSVQSAHSGGSRSKSLHKGTISLVNQQSIRNRVVYLFDDVVTTGSSLEACKEILYSAGARNVRCYAAARTQRQ